MTWEGNEVAMKPYGFLPKPATNNIFVEWRTLLLVRMLLFTVLADMLTMMTLGLREQVVVSSADDADDTS
jgi:hypothetical protein